MSIEEILEHYARELESTQFIHLFRRDAAVREGTQIVATAMIWYFSRAVGLTVDQVNAGLITLTEGRKGLH